MDILPDWNWVQFMMKHLGPYGMTVWMISFMVFAGLTAYAVYREATSRAEAGNAATFNGSPSAVTQQVGTATAPVNQTGGDKIEGDKVEGDKVVNNYLVVPDDTTLDVRATRETVVKKTTSGRDANVDIYVLWREASWKPNRDQWNREKDLRNFLASSRLANALANEDVIACVGLVSNEMRSETQNARADEKETKLGALSDRRGERLCELVAQETATISMVPKFISVGLGYNMHPGDRDQDIKQRALVLLGIKAATGKPFEKDEVDSIIHALTTTDRVTDFNPGEYSRVVEKRPICWRSIERGVYSPKDCGDAQ